MKLSFRRIFQVMALCSAVVLTSCSDEKDPEAPRVPDIVRDLAIDQTYTFTIGGYSCDNAYVGEIITNTDGTQTFQPLHTGTCMVTTNNHSVAQYRINVLGTIDVFPSLNLSWGTSYEDMMEILGITEADAKARNEVFQYHALYVGGFTTKISVKKTVTVTDETTGADKQEEQDFNVNGYTFYFDDQDKLDHVEVLFQLKDLDTDNASGLENLELYLGQNYLASTATEGEWFNALEKADAKTVVNVTEEVPSYNDATLVVFKKN